MPMRSTSGWTGERDEPQRAPRLSGNGPTAAGGASQRSRQSRRSERRPAGRPAAGAVSVRRQRCDRRLDTPDSVLSGPLAGARSPTTARWPMIQHLGALQEPS